MDKQQLVEKTAEALRPFETSNLITTIQHLSIKQIITHPVVLVLMAVILFFAVVRRAKAARIALIVLPCLALIARYGMPEPDVKFTILSMAPLIGGGVFIAAVIIYYVFIKTD